jgi:hypothetical protein
MGGRPAPGVPQVGESANRPQGRRRIDHAADDERNRHPYGSDQTKGGVMLKWEHNRAIGPRPQRKPRGARQIALAARAEQRNERRRRFRRSR